MESPLIIESANFAKPVGQDTGFPFDDSDYETDVHLRGRLNNITQRIPSLSRFFDDDDWHRSPRSFDDKDDLRSHLSGHSSSSGESNPRSRFRDTDRFFRHDKASEKPPEAPRDKRSRRPNPNLPQQLSNTVDLGQKQVPVNENRSQRSMSAPPENRSAQSTTTSVDDGRPMGGSGSKAQPPKERIIPIHVEGRDEPYIPKNVKPTAYAPFKRDSPQNWQQPHQSSYTIPLNKAFTQQQQQQAPPAQAAPPPAPSSPAQRESPPPSNDPIDKIKCVKNDVLELMTQVDQFNGSRKDKNYIYLDEMLTRNLLKLDDIETDGKENIRLARKEAIKCIQSSINKLEEKAQAGTKKAAEAEAMETTETTSGPVNLNAVPADDPDTNEPPVYESKATLFISGDAPEAPKTKVSQMEVEIVEPTEAPADPQPADDTTSQTPEDTK